jgi:hypothetical protein
MQLHLYLEKQIDRRLRENGIDPDNPEKKLDEPDIESERITLTPDTIALMPKPYRRPTLPTE